MYKKYLFTVIIISSYDLLVEKNQYIP